MTPLPLITEAQIDAAVEAQCRRQWAPHELPLDPDLLATVRETARLMLEAAAREPGLPLTPPAPVAGWDAEAAARELEREWMLASSLAEQRAIFARHLTLARSTAPSAEAMRRCIEQFADHKNWYDAVGCLQWMGKRHAIDYAESVLSALPPAQPPAVGDDDESTRDTLLLLNEAISLGRRDGMCGQHLDAMCSARDEIERLSVLTATTLPAVRRAVQAALRSGLLAPEDAPALGDWLRLHPDGNGPE